MDMSLSMKIPRSRTHLTGVTESEPTESGVTDNLSCWRGVCTYVRKFISGAP